jgi:hypothetical protein
MRVEGINEREGYMFVVRKPTKGSRLASTECARSKSVGWIDWDRVDPRGNLETWLP